MFNLMTSFTKRLKIRENIVVPISVSVVNNQKSIRFAPFARVFPKLSIGLNSALPHRVLRTKSIHLGGVSSILTKSRTVLRWTFEPFQIRLGSFISTITDRTQQDSNGSLIIGNLSLDKRSTSHTVDYINQYKLCI